MVTAFIAAGARGVTLTPCPPRPRGDHRVPLNAATSVRSRARVPRNAVGSVAPVELFAGDRAQVHLVGAVGQPQRPRPGVEVGQREVVAHAAGAVHLDGPVDDRAGDAGDHDLDAGDL